MDAFHNNNNGIKTNCTVAEQLCSFNGYTYICRHITNKNFEMLRTSRCFRLGFGIKYFPRCLHLICRHVRQCLKICIKVSSFSQPIYRYPKLGEIIILSVTTNEYFSLWPVSHSWWGLTNPTICISYYTDICAYSLHIRIKK